VLARGGETVGRGEENVAPDGEGLDCDPEGGGGGEVEEEVEEGGEGGDGFTVEG
jgi:hypothetical protein